MTRKKQLEQANPDVGGVWSHAHTWDEAWNGGLGTQVQPVGISFPNPAWYSSKACWGSASIAISASPTPET